MESLGARAKDRGVPTLGGVAFALAMVAGVCAGVSLLINFASGAGGFYAAGWVEAFFASLGAMVALLGLSIWIGVRSLSRRGARSADDRSRFFLAVAELVAIGGLVAAVELRVGGYAVPLLADLSIAAFIGGLIRWNAFIWRRLTA